MDQPLDNGPRERAGTKEALLEAEDDQAFLQRLSHAEPAPQRKKEVEEAALSSSDSPLASFFSNLLKDKVREAVMVKIRVA